MDQGGAAQIDDGRDLLRCLDSPGLQFEHPQSLQPGQDADQQQPGQQKEGSPEQAKAFAKPGGSRGRRILERARASIGSAGVHRVQGAPSGTNTYPTPQTVCMNRGLAGSDSIILRSREICTSRLRSNGSNSLPRASWASFSRDMG